MNRPIFESVFKNEINSYLDAKLTSGYKEICYWNALRSFDRFCTQKALTALVLSRDISEEWCRKRNNEAATTHYARVNLLKNFIVYLWQKGCNVHLIRDVAHRETQFQPHIYTEDETKRYFYAVDAYSSSRNRIATIQYPILFRLLYCCGTRIGETLGIRKKDVDLNTGIIKLHETKNNHERYVVLGEDLHYLMKRFADKYFYMLLDDDYIFRSANGGKCTGDNVYDLHRSFLKKANIPFVGNGEGPRVHDWRHTHAVNAFKQMIDSGMDMYVALPVLSTYLGHKTIYATERYVRLTMALFPYINEQFKEKIDEVFGGLFYETD